MRGGKPTSYSSFAIVAMGCSDVGKGQNYAGSGEKTEGRRVVSALERSMAVCWLLSTISWLSFRDLVLAGGREGGFRNASYAVEDGSAEKEVCSVGSACRERSAAQVLCPQPAASSQRGGSWAGSWARGRVGG